MNRRTLKGTDLSFNPIAYGCWRLAEAGKADPGVQSNATLTEAKIQTAIEVGMDFIDTADIYTSRWPDGFGEAEALLGAVLKANPALRDQMVLATKGGIIPGLPYDSSEAYLISACEASLRRLNTDVIDLYQIHRPDLLASAREVASALNHLKKSGKIRAVGVSNYTPAQFNALQAHLDFDIASHQSEFSPWTIITLFDGTLDQTQEKDIPMFAWSPLAAGILVAEDPAISLNEAETTRKQAVIATLDTLAEKYGCDRGMIALAFTLKHPGNVVPIVGTQSLERIQATPKVLEIDLTRREWYDILEARLGHPMP